MEFLSNLAFELCKVWSLSQSKRHRSTLYYWFICHDERKSATSAFRLSCLIYTSDITWWSQYGLPKNMVRDRRVWWERGCRPDLCTSEWNGRSNFVTNINRFTNFIIEEYQYFLIDGTCNYWIIKIRNILLIWSIVFHGLFSHSESSHDVGYNLVDYIK